MAEKNQLLLIDGNGLLHRAFHAYPFLTTSSGEQVNAVYGFAIMLMQVLDKFKPKYIAVTFDKKGPTFRHQEFTQYKAQRKPMDDGLASQITRTYELVESFNIPIYAIEGYEADDLIGTIVRQMEERIHEKITDVDEVIIVTGDRDLLQLLSDHTKAYMPGKTFSEGSVVDVAAFQEKYKLESPRQLIEFKALRGDASDNIPGVAGIGEVGATKLISKYGNIENLYAHIDEIDEKTRHKLVESAEMAALSKKLATIDTNAPFTFDLDSCETEVYDKEKVIRLFEVLEFKSLVKRMQGNGSIGATQNGKKINKPAKTEQMFEEEVGDAKEELKKYLKDQPAVIVNLDLEMVDVLQRMKETGVLVDQPCLKVLSKDFSEKLEKLTKQIYAIAGHEFNLNSPKQLAEVLFDDLKLPVIKRTKTGRSTDEEVLNELALTQEIAQRILEYRELFKLKSTYIDALPNYIAEDGRIHSTFRLDIAATGRLSSIDPNMQNIPIKGQWGMAIRKAFVAPAGRVLLACDYSQIELRILAHLSGDEGMQAIFTEGRDIHASTAALIFNVLQDQVTKDQRRSAKAVNFGLLYGMGPHALSKDLKITFAQAQLFIKAYFEAFPKVKKWIEETLQRGQELGYVETIMGRRRYLPELQSADKRLKSAGERMAVNMPAQGTQAEMIKLAMVHLDQIILHSGGKIANYNPKVVDENAKFEKVEFNFQESEIAMILQVHDELIFEVDEDKVEEWIPVVTKEMREALPLSIPVEVGVAVGKSWGEMK